MSFAELHVTFSAYNVSFSELHPSSKQTDAGEPIDERLPLAKNGVAGFPE